MSETITRRKVLEMGVGATVAAPLAGLLPAASAAAAPLAAAAAAGAFFSAGETALLDELTEMIIPADERSGGARAAGVVPFLDRTLAEKDPRIPDHAEERGKWKEGLGRVDAVAREMHGKPFLELSPDERLAVMGRMAKNEQDPKTPEERFFGELKRATAHAYYTSKVGIKDDIGYKGNTLLTEFVGVDVSKG